MSASESELRKFLDDVAEIACMSPDKPEWIVGALRMYRQRDDRFQEWAQSYLNSGRWAGHDRADAIKTELLARDEEVKRLRTALERLASYEAFTSLWNNHSPATAGYRSELRARADFAKEALAVGEEVTR